MTKIDTKVGFVLLPASGCEQCTGQPTTLQVRMIMMIIFMIIVRMTMTNDDNLHDNRDDDHDDDLHDNS